MHNLGPLRQHLTPCADTSRGHDASAAVRLLLVIVIRWLPCRGGARAAKLNQCERPRTTAWKYLNARLNVQRTLVPLPGAVASTSLGRFIPHILQNIVEDCRSFSHGAVLSTWRRVEHLPPRRLNVSVHNEGGLFGRYVRSLLRFA